MLSSRVSMRWKNYRWVGGENEVRTGLRAGGDEIRTLDPPAASGASRGGRSAPKASPGNREAAQQMAAHAQARARYRTLDRRDVKGQGGRGGPE